MPVNLNNWKTVRGFVGAGSRLHLTRVQERAPYKESEKSLCGIGPVTIERSDWPTDWKKTPLCIRCKNRELSRR